MQKSFLENTRKRVLLNRQSRKNLIWLLLSVATFGLVIFSAFSYDKEKGKKLYIEQCSKCHRKDGKGIKGVYPPLKNSDYVQKGDKIELLRGMLFGRSGKIVVNGEVYYGVMTTEVDKNLKDEEIALILEYVFRELNGIDKSVTSEDVVKARKLGKLPPHK
ncbi:cytochrome c [Bacteroidetes/Chlorobi group bacterium MS-B_bin-24]|jgi:mono/diheme cytochrome c family protein|nr:MAG: cytochrome c [Bacteroidetes/Chlorobi group bacterium MS-B_bin-24]